MATLDERHILLDRSAGAGPINQTSPASEGRADRREGERTLAQGGAGCMPNAEEEKPVLHRPAKEGQAMRDEGSQDGLDLDFQTGPGRRISGLCDKTPVEVRSAAQAEEGGREERKRGHECKAPDMSQSAVKNPAAAFKSRFVCERHKRELADRGQEIPLVPVSDLAGIGAAMADPRRKMEIFKEISNELLESYYSFKEGAPLKRYICMKKGSVEECYTLIEVLVILKDIIRDEGMFDKDNPSVIICDEKLKAALHAVTIHVTEIREIVSSQLLRLPDKYQAILKNAAAERRKREAKLPAFQAAPIVKIVKYTAPAALSKARTLEPITSLKGKATAPVGLLAVVNFRAPDLPPPTAGLASATKAPTSAAPATSSPVVAQTAPAAEMRFKTPLSAAPATS